MKTLLHYHISSHADSKYCLISQGINCPHKARKGSKNVSNVKTGMTEENTNFRQDIIK